MKKIILFFFTGLLVFTGAVAQSDSTGTDNPVYLRFPTIPQFTLYKAPDSTAFTRDDLHKKKNTIFIVFSPDCEHCQRETEMITRNMDQFKNTQFVMVTYLPYEEMIRFYHDYNISQYPQITMARDTRFFFPVFFKVTSLPAIFVYDKKGNFVKAFEGDIKPATLLSAL